MALLKVRAGLKARTRALFSLRREFVERERFEHDRVLESEPRLEAGLGDGFAIHVEVGIRRDHRIDTAARLQPLSRLLEKIEDVLVACARVPARVGEILRLARMLRRARHDHIEHGFRLNRFEKIATKPARFLSQAVRLGIFRRGSGGVRVDICSDNRLSTRACRGKGNDARSCSNIDHCLAGKVKAVDKFGESLAADEIAGMENGWRDSKPEPRHSRHLHFGPAQHEMIRQIMKGIAQGPPQRAVGAPRPVQRCFLASGCHSRGIAADPELLLMVLSLVVVQQEPEQA